MAEVRNVTWSRIQDFQSSKKHQHFKWLITLKTCCRAVYLRNNTLLAWGYAMFCNEEWYYSIFRKLFCVYFSYVSFKIRSGIIAHLHKTTSGEIPQISQSEILIQMGLGSSSQWSANQNFSYIKALVYFATRGLCSVLQLKISPISQSDRRRQPCHVRIALHQRRAI